MVLFLIASKAKDVPTRRAGKLLNLDARDGSWRGYDALMRALPRFAAHCQRTLEPVESSLIPAVQSVRIITPDAAGTRQTGYRTDMSKPFPPAIVNYGF